jgi:hypothetical protein
MEIRKFVIGASSLDCATDHMCMAIHKRLHIADPEVGELAERLSRLMGKQNGILAAIGVTGESRKPGKSTHGTAKKSSDIAIGRPEACDGSGAIDQTRD